MKIRMTERLDTVAEVSLWEILKLLCGRELKVPGEQVFLRQPRAYEAFNAKAQPQPGRP